MCTGEYGFNNPISGARWNESSIILTSASPYRGLCWSAIASSSADEAEGTVARTPRRRALGRRFAGSVSLERGNRSVATSHLPGESKLSDK